VARSWHEFFFALAETCYNRGATNTIAFVCLGHAHQRGPGGRAVRWRRPDPQRTPQVQTGAVCVRVHNVVQRLGGHDGGLDRGAHTQPRGQSQEEEVRLPQAGQQRRRPTVGLGIRQQRLFNGPPLPGRRHTQPEGAEHPAGHAHGAKLYRSDTQEETGYRTGVREAFEQRRRRRRLRRRPGRRWRRRVPAGPQVRRQDPDAAEHICPTGNVLFRQFFL